MVYSRIRVAATGVVAALVLCMACRGGKADKPLLSRQQTLAELRTVKRGVSVAPAGEVPRAPYPRERLIDGEAVRIEPGGLAWLRRDGGATLLVAGPADLVVRAADVQVTRGKIFVDTQATEAAVLSTPRGPLHLSDVRASVEVREDGHVGAYVLAGGVQTERGMVARPGELLSLAPGGQVSKSPAAVWDDWTGGLATTDPASRPAPFGVGTVGARKPGSQGEARFPLSIQRLDVRVKVDGDFATTEVDEVFFNPTSDTVEGIYRFRTPAGAVLQRFGVDRDGDLVWGRLKEKQAAAAQYESHVYQGSTEDPALLEWEAPGVYQARLYPIEPGATRRVVTRYGEWLSRQGARGERRMYVYPMAARGTAASLPRIEELTVDFDVSLARASEIRVGMLGKQVGSRVTVKGFDVVPRSDLALELFDGGVSSWTAYRAAHLVDRDTTAKDQIARAEKDARGEADYVLVPVRPPRGKEPAGGLDLAILVDTSAAIEPGSLAIARAMTSALLSHLGPQDRAAVWAGDATLRPVTPGSERLAAVDAARRDAIVTGLARIDRGGATDLGALVADAAALFDGSRRGALVYLGDGEPTVGELAVKELRARLDRLPRPVRLFAIGIGDRANMGLLKGLARGAFAERVTDGFGAAESALRVLEDAERPAWQGARLDLGPGVDRVFPRELTTLVADETALVVGRVVGALPKEVRLRGTGGEVSERLSVAPIADGGDLKRRWAEGRLDQLLDEGAGRAALVEVGVRFGVVTPVTSFYVPTADEYRRERGTVVADLDPSDTKPWWRWPWFTAVALRGAAQLAPVAVSVPEPEAVEEAADDREGGTGTRAKGEEGAMRKAGKARSGNKRYAVQGPKDAPDPHIRRQASLREAQDFGMVGLLGGGAAKEDATVAEPMPQKSTPTAAAAPAERAGSLEAPRSAAVAASAAPASPAPTTEVEGNLFPSADTKQLEAPAQEKPDSAPGGLDGVGPGGGGLGRLGMGRGIGAVALFAARSERDESAASNVVLVSHTRGAIGHAPRPCPTSADLPFEERRLLWGERLVATGGAVTVVATVYRTAVAACEVPTWRERAVLLALLVQHVPTVRERVQLWRHFRSNPQAADVVYRAILTRVDTAEEIRALHDALGIRELDPGMLEKVLVAATTPDARVKALRELFEKWPDDLELGLRLLEALEDAGKDPEGRAFARELRRRGDATTRARTALGEYYLRLAKRQPGPAAERDTVEARRTFGEIVEFAPEDPGARRRLGDLLRTHGWYEEALRQYETLARLSPDDATVPLLLAAAAAGMGRVEEAIRWTEKAAEGSGDAASALGKTSRALASAYLAWARDEATRGGRNDEAERLRERARRLSAVDPEARDNVRFVLTWSHPEFHPDLWSNALGAPMPAPDGNPLLGVAEAVLPVSLADGFVEVRLDKADLERAARLGARATLTAITGEGSPGERIARLELGYSRADNEASGLRRFRVDGGTLREVAP